MTTYRTPGVYVQEISLFPPSVAEVETAIPAFIGYTEKADLLGPDDLRNVPTMVTSLLEYQQLFGGAPPVEVNEIVLDENNAVKSYKVDATFYLYDSLRLFFQNGGGKCYIISVGSYKDTPSKNHFLDAGKGLDALKKKDEPTLILFPDAVLFDDGGLYEIQKQALTQCNDLQDRFTIMDLLESKSADPTYGWKKGYEDFRDNVGINYLKYGAAYTPWLRSNLGIDISYRDIKGKVTRGGQVVGLDSDSLTKNAQAKATVTDLNNAIDDVDRVENDLITLRGSQSTLGTKYQSLLDDFRGNTNVTTFKALFNYIYSLATTADAWVAGPGTLKGGLLKTDIKNLITNSMSGSMTALIGYDKGAGTALTGGVTFDLYKTKTVAATEWGTIFAEATSPAADTTIFTGTTNVEKMRAAESSVSQIFSQMSAAFASIYQSANTYEQQFEDSLLSSHAVFKNLIAKLSAAMTVLPPSGAVAGVYAAVDANRGVWKAPANVSLAAVSGVTEFIDDKEQEELNIDVTAGKSINAIRPFTGKGVLVWGARTLAGNDNEWRYVPVRRFFNMVEESIKKSTAWAVFEPNDANTWIKVKSMIENYLIQKWRDGALVGAKADDAFFVKVGLGVTMTAQDILEGRMNVEIGMAVVRPAEFIILKFSHKMQKS
ncbi:MAG: Phage tail sheath protein [Syntrophorhabdaceae bacterium PtaU1.Bin034]|nr:MAG: Phage tail sheath protein [Syntrophorhabdaceae bacterium PtaU1.Bin034]